MKLTEHCHVLYGLVTIPPWMVNAGFIRGGHTTLVVDTGYNYLSAQTIYGYAQTAKPDNDILALNTEPHSDHMAGNCFFNERGIPIPGHADIHRTDADHAEIRAAYHASITCPVRKAHHEENVIFHKTCFVNPTRPVDRETVLDLGSLEARILLAPGHTPMNLMVHVPGDGVLFAGDTLINGNIPNMAETDADGWRDWLTTLDRLEALAPRIVVPGHGEAMKDDAIRVEVERTRRMLHDAIETGVPPAP